MFSIFFFQISNWTNFGIANWWKSPWTRLWVIGDKSHFQADRKHWPWCVRRYFRRECCINSFIWKTRFWTCRNASNNLHQRFIDWTPMNYEVMTWRNIYWWKYNFFSFLEFYFHTHYVIDFNIWRKYWNSCDSSIWFFFADFVNPTDSNLNLIAFFSWFELKWIKEQLNHISSILINVIHIYFTPRMCWILIEF